MTFSFKALLPFLFLVPSAFAVEKDGKYLCCYPELSIQQLIKKLDAGPWSVSRDVCCALKERGSDAKAAVPNLIKALSNNNNVVRNSAADALGGIGKDAEAAIPELIEACSDGMYTVRKNAASGLGLIGNSSPEVVGTLKKVLNDSNEEVRHAAGAAIGRLDSDEARKSFEEYKSKVIPELLKKINPKKLKTGWGGLGSGASHAAEVLGEIGPDAAVAVPDLISLLKATKKDWKKIQVACALYKIGTPEGIEAALPVLRDLFESSDTPYIKRDAFNALKSIESRESLEEKSF